MSDGGGLLRPPTHTHNHPGNVGNCVRKLHLAQVLWAPLPDLHNSFSESCAKTTESVRVSGA